MGEGLLNVGLLFEFRHRRATVDRATPVVLPAVLVIQGAAVGAPRGLRIVGQDLVLTDGAGGLRRGHSLALLHLIHEGGAPYGNLVAMMEPGARERPIVDVHGMTFRKHFDFTRVSERAQNGVFGLHAIIVEQVDLALRRRAHLHDVLEEEKLFARKPGAVVENAVRGMLPKNRLGRQLFRNLYVYTGEEHPHEGQQPKEIKLNDIK